MSLNRAFLEANNAVLLGCDNRRLTVGMIEPGDQRLLEAMRVGTDLEIVTVKLSPEEVRFQLAAQVSPRGPSVLERIFRQLPVRSPEVAFAPLALLLQAGVATEAAGKLLLDADSRGPRLDGRVRITAVALQRGVPLAAALEARGEALAWISGFLATLPASLDRSAIFARLILPAAGLERIGQRTRRLTWEIAAFSLLVLAAWYFAEPGALPVLTVIALIAWAHAYQLRTRRADSDLVRSEILHMVGTLAALPIAPALCIRAGLTRLSGDSPQSCERNDLAAQLKLGIIDTAVLINMDLATGALQMADVFARRAEEARARFAWAVRLAALLAAAIVFGLSGAPAPRAELADAQAGVRFDTPASSAPRSAEKIAATATAAAGPATPAPFVLIGIAGRLPGEAEVLVRAAWGETTVMRVGDSFMGWTLNHVAADRITVQARGQTRELRMPGGK